MEKKTHFVRDFLQNSIGNSSSSTTCNPIYIAGTILQLQITMEFCRPHEKHLKPHLQCGTDPTMIRPWSENDPIPHTRPSRTRRTAEVDHRRSGTDFVWKNAGFRASAISQKRIFRARLPSKLHRQLIHQHHLQSHLHCGNDPTVANHNGILSTARKTLETPFTMRNRSDHDPTMVREWSDHGPRMIRPHARPSRTRRTAEVDHRRSGTHFVWKNTGFRASAISQKRISCETSFKTPSATHPPAPLAIPFTLRERSYSCRSVDRTCTKNTWNPIYNAEPIRPWSENDPTTHETVSHPSHRRGRSSTFGDGLCLEKHRVSCICYLSKTHFVRDFLQNSIGNSSTSTTCNPIYIAGTILQLQITMEFCRPHEKHLKPHLQCGTDPTMIRPWSENDPTTHETVSHPSHRRGRSSTFGDGLCMEKRRVSCICYLSKTHISCETSFKTPSATHPAAPLAIPFTLRDLKNAFRARLPSKLHRQLIHQHHLQSHLHCGNNFFD